MTRKWMLFAGLVATLAVACGDKDEEDEDDGDEDDTSSSGDDTGGAADDTGGGGDDGGGDGVSPTIVEADAWCYTPGGSVEGDFWGLKARVTDPQGADTIKSFLPDSVRVDSAGGGTLTTMALVCSPGAEEAVCTGSDSVANLGFGCGTADAQTFVFMIADEDGNQAEVVSVAGRQGSSADGR
jgi:hypothetical protein